MNFWKEHMGLRIILMLLTFILGMVLVIQGWRMTGQMAGLLRMLTGVILLLLTLYLYNARFADRKKR